MYLNVDHYNFESALRTFNRINNGDITPEQFVHEISHATAYLSYFSQQQIFHRILGCENTNIYYALRKIEFKNLPCLINFLTEAFVCPYLFGYFAVKLDDSNRDQDEHFDNCNLRLQNILQKAEMVFVRELPSTLYQDVYDSAPECLDNASKLADYFYYTNGARHRPIISKQKSVTSIEIPEDVSYYYPASRFENTCTKLDNYDCYGRLSSAEETAARSSNSEYEYDFSTNNFKNSLSYYSESSEIDPDVSFTTTIQTQTLLLNFLQAQKVPKVMYLIPHIQLKTTIARQEGSITHVIKILKNRNVHSLIFLLSAENRMSSKFHNCVNRYRDFKNPGADPHSAFLRSDLLTGGYN
ncbi:hypothetical protein TSAR_014778 [Trichomalopsis sarcophagae]|uniref:Uncharacterized protein n=1 Tax=Trichomalopsis sarcophagae TaxID=543379 RepID=A0A232FKI5_9HYME|nr:hypothetical protein TSAR_014778 [Trichomalopsis sarcophagae]